jgi:hypothetical protein
MTPSASEQAFLAGRDLAVRFLRHMQDEGASDAFSLESRYRDGAPQNNVARSYLLQLIQRPELLDGFAAVMSDGFGNGFADADVYSSLTLGEMLGPRGDKAFQAVMAKCGP